MRIKIGPVLYDLVVIENLKGDEGQDLYGQANHRENTIELNARYKSDQRFLTLWHEVIHCFEPVYGLELQEDQIIALSAVIVMAIMDNPILRGEYVADDQLNA